MRSRGRRPHQRQQHPKITDNLSGDLNLTPPPPAPPQEPPPPPDEDRAVRFPGIVIFARQAYRRKVLA